MALLELEWDFDGDEEVAINLIYDGVVDVDPAIVGQCTNLLAHWVGAQDICQIS